MTDDERIAALCVVARRFILKAGWSRDSCLASTRIGIEVLSYFGITGKPLEVTVVAANALAVEQLDRTGAVDLSTDAWTVGVKAGDRDEGDNAWPGAHMVISVPRMHTIVDLSVDQLHRPQHEIEVPRPVAFEAKPEFFTGERAVQIELPKDGRLFYWPVNPPTGTRGSPDWTMRPSERSPNRPEIYRATVAAIIRAMCSIDRSNGHR